MSAGGMFEIAVWLSWGTIPDTQDSSKKEGRVAYGVFF